MSIGFPGLSGRFCASSVVDGIEAQVNFFSLRVKVQRLSFGSLGTRHDVVLPFKETVFKT